MTPSKMTAALAASLLTMSLAACTDTPADDDSSSSSSDSSTSAASADRSDEVFKASKAKPKVLDSTSGEITIGIGGGTTGKVTFQVTGVTATSTSTVLHYQLVADEEITFVSRGAFWDQQPSLRVPGTKVRTQTVTATVPNHDGEPEMCACTSVREVLTESQPQEAVYPALPKGVDTIDVILDDLDPVTVPVTRK